jgi:similar to spore coat protein
MDIKKLADHESLDLHEVINFKTLCLAKSKLMQGLVFDHDLRALMKKDVEQSMQAFSTNLLQYGIRYSGHFT